MKQTFNPYMPFWETVPDGEAHVFGNRVYVYGSHDKLGGDSFCTEDYVCWSAPVDDLGDWRWEGVIYRKDQDPINGAPYQKEFPEYENVMKDSNALHTLYAPDVAQGRDGRYYLYYALDFCNILSVAVSDSPTGPFEFLDYVLTPEGKSPETGRKFDPAILAEESGNYLYYGFCPAFRFPGMETVQMPGLMMVKLADDMHTVISEPVLIANGIDTSKGTSFEEHPAFEASSIRHIGEWYYFLYSSLQGHELCYAMSKDPAGPFEYKGVVISNADFGYQGNTDPVTYWGNNHGGLEKIEDKVYVFWHRQTHGTEYSRQGCADEVQILADGTIPQTEVTSCGMNGGPLRANEMYSSYIACHLTGRSIKDPSYYSQAEGMTGHVLSKRPDDPEPLIIPEGMPYITEEQCPNAEHNLKPYISSMDQDAVAGFKYFNFEGENRIKLELRGKGEMVVMADGFKEGEADTLCRLSAESADWNVFTEKIKPLTGKHSIYIKILFGKIDFAGIGFERIGSI